MLETKDWVYFSACGVLLLITLWQQIKLDRLERHTAFMSLKMIEIMLTVNLFFRDQKEDTKELKKETLND